MLWSQSFHSNLLGEKPEMAVRQRQMITRPDLLGIDGFDPLSGLRGLSGIRVYDVGQGDAIAVLDQDRRPVVQIDYGGREGHPFRAPLWADELIPAEGVNLLMMTHWDEDHWCAARKAEPVRKVRWLVPRQITSPRAVQFSLKVENAFCIPDTHVGRGYCFAAGRDELWWEKIAHGPGAGAADEDCNRTGVALSVVKRGPDGGGSVILIPGDAPFDRVSHYWRQFDEKLTLRGIVAFHHGAGTHWTEATEELLREWAGPTSPVQIIFSCARPNAYDHPDEQRYRSLLPAAHFKHTAVARKASRRFLDLEF